MASELDADLREVLWHLAQTPAPAGLAEAAMRRARRQRRVRTAVGAAAVVVVVGAATPVVLTAWAAGEGSPSPQAASPQVVTPPEQTRTRYVVIAYGDPWADSFWLLDPDTGEYVDVPYSGVLLSADGLQMLVQGGLGSPADPYRIGVFDRKTKDVGWVGGYTGPASWSPDGQEILVTRSSQSGGTGFAIVDVKTLTSVDLSFPLNGNPLVWTPGGDQLAMTVTEAVGDERLPDRPVAINFYDRTGQWLRSLPVGAALHATSDFSPDGTSIALYDYFDTTVTIVDAASGTVLHEIALTDHVADNLGWVDDSHLLLLLSPGLDQPNYLAFVDLTGTIVKTVDLPEQMARAGKVWVGPAGNLREEALAF
ncbi:MAG: hypothetical protein IRY85_10795 [Micromonosporaceae bacterium]|nr:hypothetical protein [Micromonosporaceae bacterium]